MPKADLERLFRAQAVPQHRFLVHGWVGAQSK